METNRPYLQSELSTREKILDSAEAEFVARGFEGARIRRIAELSGANKAMIYYYFSSKKELYRQVIKRVFQGAFQTLGGIIAGEQSLEDKFKALVSFYVNIYSQNPGYIRILLRELAAEGSIIKEVLTEVKSSLQGFRLPDAFYRVFSEGRNQGKIRPVDPGHTVISLVGMCAAFFIFRPIAETMLDLAPEEAERFGEKRADHVADLLLNGLLKSKQGGRR
ncbi:MAG TPA: TetR/AcrR family transcriptional regulator [archaeon]|nr:TetR/AcrR family transcriptional regulator [archaeon]